MWKLSPLLLTLKGVKMDVIMVKRGPGPGVVTFECERCGRTHQHGWDEGEFESHRVSHCDHYPGGYMIRLEGLDKADPAPQTRDDA